MSCYVCQRNSNLERKCSTSIGWTDPRTEIGELLWPQRVTRAELAEVKVALGSYRYAGQYQQRPTPPEGGIFKRSWWRYWQPSHLDLPPVQVRLPDGQVCSIAAVPLPARFDEVLQSWDLAFKDLETSDFVVGQVWGALQADRFLLDLRRDRLDMPKTVEAIRAMSQKWPAAARKLVEDKANGPAVIAALQHEIAGLIGVNPDGGKVARAQAVSPQCESGNVYLPHPSVAPWVEGFIDECAGFPNAAHDDQVDAMTQVLNRQFGGVIYPVPESEITVEPFNIPDHWPRAYAMVVNWRVTAALWGAWDRQNDRIYLYNEYLRHDTEPLVHAEAIRSRGIWIRGVIDPASGGRSQVEGWQLLDMYRELGLDLESAHDATESGIYAVWRRMSSGRLKVFTSLSNYLGARRLYKRDEKGRVVDQDDSLLNCCHSLVLYGGDQSRTAPVPESHEDPYCNCGSQSWMAL